MLAEEAECKEDEGPHCCQRGDCCCYVLLSTSPRALAREYNTVCGSMCDKTVVPMDGIALIYPMLTGTCRGKWRNPDTGEIRYGYGPCRHLGTDAAGKAICHIHQVKPNMCRNYPFYRHGRQTEMAAVSVGPNPGYMRGCGYNVSKRDGFTPRQFDDFLIPLDTSEQEPHLIEAGALDSLISERA